MNVRDSEVIAGSLIKAGFQLVSSEEKADVVLFNTCSVRQHAEDRVWSQIGRIAKCKATDTCKGRKEPGSVSHLRNKPIIGLVGCMAQNYKGEIFEKAPAVDFAVGPSDIHKIPDIIARLVQRPTLPKKKIWETEGHIRPEEIYHTDFYEDKDHAYVVISEGCSNFCSYCVVPYVRGPLRNRNHKDIIREIQGATDKGITKITLLGQNVNAYGDDKVTFGTLLNLINNIKVLKEFTFVTSHPKDTSADLFKAIADLEKLKKCLHLPMQSGSDRILKLMSRGYTKRHYLDLVENYKRLNPKGLLSTDIIVGFPTESEKEFLETYELMKRVEFDAAYLFKYSPRPNTRAESLPNDVPKKEKERRHKCLLDFQRDLRRKSQKVAACSFAVLWFLSQTVLCWAALDIFGHSKTLRPKKKISRKQVQEKLLDYPKECILKSDYEEALNTCRELIDYPPAQKQRAEILHLAGLSCLKLGRNIEARNYFNEVILADGENEDLKANAYLGIADSYFLDERFDEASDAYERVLTDYPKDSIKVMAYYRLGEISYKIGQPGRAEYYLSKLTQEFPLSFETQLLKSLLSKEASYAVSIDNMDTYSIQVGCFANRDNADKICEKLSKEGFDVYILESLYSDEPKFKVRVGRVNSKSDAGILEARLKGAGYPTRICP